MIRSLFARLTGEPRRGQALFDVAVTEARRPQWFLQGEVPDTLNGRFAVLATITALIMVRLERDGPAGEQTSVALTERLVESLDTEDSRLVPDKYRKRWAETCAPATGSPNSSTTRPVITLPRTRLKPIFSTSCPSSTSSSVPVPG